MGDEQWLVDELEDKIDKLKEENAKQDTKRH